MDNGLNERELREQARATEGEVRELVRLGILRPQDGAHPFSDGDVWRARLALACAGLGLSLQDIGHALAEGRLSLAFFDLLRWSGAELRDETYGGLCDRRGVSFELLARVHDALGFARPLPDDRTRADAGPIVDVLAVGAQLGVDEDAVVRAFRVYGENLRRVAQAEARFYHAQVEQRLLASGMDENEMRAVATGMSNELMPVVEKLVLSIYYRHQEHYALADLVEHVEDVVGAARQRSRAEAIIFLDLAGFTRLTEQEGDDVAAALAASLARVVQATAASHGGEAVKWLGDGVMLHFQDPGAAVLAALEMVERSEGAGLPPPYVGIHAGPVILQDGDYYGRTVNVASRVVTQAQPMQTLVTDAVLTCGPVPGVAFHPVAEARLRGVADPVMLYEAVRAPGSPRGPD
ncbi:MAG TPA: adenylate/guanylate cyclase domain-containing protein [Actinomycetota bacterium]|nr:adenylate/guanylate cyclase domain-containing protein [Actinomycetota bacterium]